MVGRKISLLPKIIFEERNYAICRKTDGTGDHPVK
jgi:hypothetical protein